MTRYSNYSFLDDLDKTELQNLSKKLNIKLTLNGSYKTNFQYRKDIKKVLMKLVKIRKQNGGTILTYDVNTQIILAKGSEFTIYYPPFSPFYVIEIFDNLVHNLTPIQQLSHISENISSYIGKVAINPKKCFDKNIRNIYSVLKQVKFMNQTVNIEQLLYITEIIEGEYQKEYQYIFENYGNPLSYFSLENSINIKDCVKNLIDDVFILNNNNIIHFDIKFNNILYKNTEDHFTLIDFGMSILYDCKITLIDKIFASFNGSSIPSLYPIECLIIYLLKRTIFVPNKDITKKHFFQEFTSKNRNLIILQIALFLPKGLVEQYISAFNYEIKYNDSKYYFEDNYQFFSEKDIEVSEEGNIITDKNIIIEHIFTKYISIFESLLLDKNNDDIITINDFIPDDYYKKIDVFYLGILFSYINKNIKQDLFSKEIIQNCVNFDYTARYTINELKKIINEQYGSGYGTTKSSKAIYNKYTILNKSEKSSKKSQKSRKTGLSSKSKRTNDIDYTEDEFLENLREFSIKHTYTNKYILYNDDFNEEELQNNISVFINSVKTIEI